MPPSRLHADQVDVARSVREGSDLVRENSYDLITLDLNLPDVDGFEVARLLAALDGQRPNTISLGMAADDQTAKLRAIVLMRARSAAKPWPDSCRRAAGSTPQ